jgi:hypothetical protein
MAEDLPRKLYDDEDMDIAALLLLSIADLTRIEITKSQHLFKQSSTAFLAITFIIFFAYNVLKFIKNMKSNYGLDVSSL